MTPSARTLRVAAALMLALATIVGALGAHALKTRLTADRYEVLQTAVHYQFFHALGLLALGVVAERENGVLLRRAGALLLLGTLLFSGSLYVLLAGAPRWLGVVTPLGGVSLIAGWLLAALAFARQRSS
jgi:uncharacterized membrane protein YgdD (TMEM256/DUF423 family)